MLLVCIWGYVKNNNSIQKQSERLEEFVFRLPEHLVRIH